MDNLLVPNVSLSKQYRVNYIVRWVAPIAKKVKELKTLKSIVSKSCVTNDEKCKNWKVLM